MWQTSGIADARASKSFLVVFLKAAERLARVLVVEMQKAIPLVGGLNLESGEGSIKI